MTRYFPPYPELGDAVRTAYGVEIVNEWSGREAPDILIWFWEALNIFVE